MQIVPTALLKGGTEQILRNHVPSQVQQTFHHADRLLELFRRRLLPGHVVVAGDTCGASSYVKSYVC